KYQTIEDMQNIAKSRGGECLSKEYINAKTRLTWQCQEGHVWKATPDTVKQGKWCRICSYKERGLKHLRYSISNLHALAKERGGVCLSNIYHGSKNKYEWKCKQGHIWNASWDNVMRGKWCPVCAGSRMERSCRIIFELLFQKKFRKSKPKWLINPYTTNRLELDGYCKSLHLAFEYHGAQHYSQHKFFSKTEEEFQIRKEIDKIKKRLCKEHNVTLIEIPYFIKDENLANFIVKKIQENNIKIERIPIEIYDYKSLDGVFSPEKLKECQELAKSKGGECLSKRFISAHSNLWWRCKEGHEWEAKPSRVKSRTWCPFCAGKYQTIEDMQNIAKSRGGKCLSKEYINTKTKLRWKCSEGHEWDATPNMIKNGTWCPICAGKYQTIEDMQNIAQECGGKCLSTIYINSDTPLRWKCSEGHEWDAKYYNLRRKDWCPVCRKLRSEEKRKRHSLAEMKQIAKERHAECLSEEYINSKTKMKWRCEKGHEWDAIPNSIKSGSWCPDCRGTQRSNIDEMQNIAKSRGGECLSTEYVNQRTKLRWRCKEGHEWDTQAGNVKNGTWCPFCAGTVKSNIHEMERIAIERGGECLSTVYVNNRTSLKWRCKEGHEWNARPSNIKTGTWCPYCYGNLKYSIEKMQQIARSKGGECLSKEYFGNKTKLRWRCAEGHEWEAIPSTILNQGSWCPFCSRKKGN
ncbi:MAG: zinc-ribbon domain-containing protein, partial [Thermoplasmata archaeon]|nr:zinc-ribbon domain-containing protein [Thermoplasmata archaeon]